MIIRYLSQLFNYDIIDTTNSCSSRWYNLRGNIIQIQNSSTYPMSWHVNNIPNFMIFRIGQVSPIVRTHSWKSISFISIQTTQGIKKSAPNEKT